MTQADYEAQLNIILGDSEQREWSSLNCGHPGWMTYEYPMGQTPRAFRCAMCERDAVARYEPWFSQLRTALDIQDRDPALLVRFLWRRKQESLAERSSA